MALAHDLAPGRAWTDVAERRTRARTSDIRRAFILLLFFHLILIGARLRFGAFPLELFFVASIPAIYLVLRQLAFVDNGKVDQYGLLVLALMALQIGWAFIDILRYGDFVVERVYLSFHRFVPLFVFYFMCMYRDVLLRAGAIDILRKLVSAGLCLHVGVTLASTQSQEILNMALEIGRFIEATSERSLGGVASVYQTVEGITHRTPGLLKYPTANAGYIATAGALALYFYYREGRLWYLTLALLATAACVLTFSRAGTAAMALGFFTLLLCSFNYRKITVFGWVSFSLVGVVVGVVLMADYLSPAFLEAAWVRFSQFWELSRFHSMQLKLEATERFFDILVNDYLILGYPGIGLNNLYLYGQGKLFFDNIETGMVSNGWLLFMFDMGLYYGLIVIATAICFAWKAYLLRNGLLIFILPFYFLVYVDNYYVTVFEFHSLFWLLQGVIVLLLTESVSHRIHVGRSPAACPPPRLRRAP